MKGDPMECICGSSTLNPDNCERCYLLAKIEQLQAIIDEHLCVNKCWNCGLSFHSAGIARQAYLLCPKCERHERS